MTSPLPILLDITVLAVGLILLLWEAFDDDREKTFLGWFAILGIGAAFVFSFFVTPFDFSNMPQLAQFYAGDPMAIFYKRFALGATLIVLIMAVEFRPLLAKAIPGVGQHAGTGEFFAIPVFTCLGLMWMASAVDFIMIFVALELVTISFYVLVSYMRRNIFSLEAGVKYLILGAFSTGFLVYGITWIFGITGETNLHRIGEVIAVLPPEQHVPLLFGMALVLVGLGFKVAAVPFQIWIPDVYQGAPTPITAFLSVGSKAAGFVVLLRVVEPFLASPIIGGKLMAVLGGMALLTLLYGNLAAMPQDNLKRLLAYSSIAHAGYLLMAIASWGNGSTVVVTVSYYLAGYLLMTLLAFLVMVVLNKATGGDALSDFNGLGRRSPVLAFGMLMAMLSLAGVPFTAGFLGKFMVFRDAVAQQQWALVIVGVITVGAGFYYYLKVVRAMYWNAPSDPTEITTTPLIKTAIGVLVALIVVFGVYPQPIFNMLKSAPALEQTPPVAKHFSPSPQS